MSVERAKIRFPPTGVIFVRGQNHDDPHTSSNGAGKSTFVDAMSFALFGKPIREGKKVQLFPDNKVEPGFVEILFANDGTDIKTRRFLTKSRANISVAGKLIKVDSDAIGSYIGQDFATFRNVHVLTRQESFIFETKARRIKMFERFTNLDVVMATLKDATHQLTRLHQSNVDRLFGTLDSLKSEVVELSARIKSVDTADHVAMQSKLKTCTKFLESLDSIADRLATLDTGVDREMGAIVRAHDNQLYHARLEIDRKHRDQERELNSVSQLKSDIRKTKRGICEACGARIRREIVKSEVLRLQGMLEAATGRVEALATVITTASAHAKEFKKCSEDAFQLSSAMKFELRGSSKLISDVRHVIRRQVNDLNIELARVSTKLSSLQDSYDEARRDFMLNRERYRAEKSLLDVAGKSEKFAENNLRKEILRGYLHSFNEDLKVTLSLFAGFSGRFTDDFDIEVRGRPFSLSSTGEQMRFVLATYMNLFRYAAASKNRFNFLVFDDFDLGLDDAGRRALAEVFQKLGQSMLILVLSQSDIFQEYFPQVLSVERRNGICSYEQRYEC